MLKFYNKNTICNFEHYDIKFEYAINQTVFYKLPAIEYLYLNLKIFEKYIYFRSL